MEALFLILTTIISVIVWLEGKEPRCCLGDVKSKGAAYYSPKERLSEILIYFYSNGLICNAC